MTKLAISVAGALVLSVTGAMAQTASTSPTTATETPAIATPGTANPTAPVPGENSFTEEQAKERFVDAGYADITTLMLDDKGIWKATAKKDGADVVVSLDYQGNITTAMK